MKKTIPIRYNMHLWLLTGRSDDFVNPALNSSVSYHTADPPAEVVAARKLLRLDYKASDFYVMGALAAALATPTRRLPVDANSAFLPGMGLPPYLHVVGGTLTALDAHNAPVVRGDVAGMRGFTQVYVRKLSGDRVSITTDSDFSTEVRGKMIGDTLYIPELRDFGIDANIRPTTWAEGSTVTISVPQTNYPAAMLAADIRDDTQAISLMLDTDTLEAFVSTPRPLYKVGALASAIMLRMWDVSLGQRVAVTTFGLTFGDNRATDTEYELSAGWLVEDADEQTTAVV